MSERYGLQYAGRAPAQAAAAGRGQGSLRRDPARSLHFDTARDVLVEGDNLRVMQLLTTAYAGRFDAAYLDPPYNTGNDFIYRDRFAETKTAYLERTGQAGDAGGGFVANPETSGRFHSRWLAMMEPRLRLVHRLLAEHGVLFVSIDDHEVAQLRLLLDDIFGGECFIAQVVVVANRGGRDYLRIATGHEYLLVYGKHPEAEIRPLPRVTKAKQHEDGRGAYELRELRNRNPRFSPANRPNLHYPVWVDARDETPEALLPVFDAAGSGRTRVVPLNSRGEASVWRWGRPKLRAALVAGDPGRSEVVARRRRDGGINVYEKYRGATAKPRALWDEPQMRTEQGTRRVRELLGVAAFDHPKPVELVARCLQIGMGSDGLVLDPFAGSGTTADAVASLNAVDGGTRRSVSLQAAVSLPADAPARALGCATIADVCAARIRAACGQDGPGLRVLVYDDDASAGLKVADGAAYVRALAQREAMRASVTPDPMSLGLAAGVALDAAVEGAGDRAWWMAGPAAPVFVTTADALDRTRLQAWVQRPDAHLACRSDALDDATAAWVAAQGRPIHLV